MGLRRGPRGVDSGGGGKKENDELETERGG
jgi:hypothetical protein